MRLQLDLHHIRGIQFGDRTTLADGVLWINRQELRELLAQDKRLGEVDIDLTRPGEKCRIIQVTDVVEPRCKTSEGFVDFPGALTEKGGAGNGNTCVLRGAAVVLSEFRRVEDPPMQPGMPGHGRIIDMIGPAAELGFYGKTYNIVLVPHPAAGTSVNEYRVALKLAGLRAAVYLAKAGKDLKPDETEVYDLPPATEVSRGFEHLPKIVYVFQFFSGQHETISGYPILYGLGADRVAPTLLHPNEVLDGAIVTPYRTMGMDLFEIQNHSIIHGLYRRHGKELCFVGVVITVAHDNEHENERSATLCANLVRDILGADGAVFTKSGGGIPEVAMARTAQRCEALGVKTSVAVAHYPVDTRSAGFDGSVLFNLPEIDAMVSLGTPWAAITLPAVERVIGQQSALPGEGSVAGETETEIRWLEGVISQVGNSTLSTAVY
jgi:sarcosine reductase